MSDNNNNNQDGIMHMLGQLQGSSEANFKHTLSGIDEIKADIRELNKVISDHESRISKLEVKTISTHRKGVASASGVAALISGGIELLKYLSH